jgi:putative hydrolase of the HAD superfamily
MTRFAVIAFDADDTLWHNERAFVAAQGTLANLLARYHPPEWVAERLHQTELRNLPHFGYGIKGFALSMIETAVELTEGRITGHEIQTLIDAARAMLAAEVEVFAHVPETLARLAATYPLMLITKGDLFDQERKIGRSGIAHYFQQIEILSDKRRASYERLLRRHGIAPERFLMVGNSLRSDILPVLELGAAAVYVPHPLTWAHEAEVVVPPEQAGYYQLEHLGQLPALIAELEGQQMEQGGAAARAPGEAEA